MAKTEINIDVNLSIPTSTAFQCLKVLEMYLVENNDFKVTCKRVDGMPILALEKRKREDDGFGGVVYLE